VTAAERLARFRFRFPLTVRFRDLGAMGHVNNAVYLTYLESARIAWWLHLTGGRDLRALTMILARTEIDYRSPLLYAEEMEVGMRCTAVRRSSVMVESVLVALGAEPRLAAESRQVLVHYDYASQKPCPLTEELRQQLLAQDPDLVIEV
jgi:acyl-CoA thioester hydrolase